MDNFPQGVNSGAQYNPEGKETGRNTPVFGPRVIGCLVMLALLVTGIPVLISMIPTDVEFEYSYPDDPTFESDFTDPLVIPEYIGYGGVPAPEEYETWLSNELEVWWDANPEGLCASLGPYADSDHVAEYSGYPTAAALEEKDVQGALFDYLGIADDHRSLSANALQHTVTPDAQILGVCKGTNTGTFLQAQVGNIAVVYGLEVQSDGNLGVTTYQPVAGVMDGYEFIPDNGRGDALIRVGYGDAGFVWWEYYRLNADLMTSELIESCSGGPAYNELTGDYDDDAWELVCDLEYQP